MRPGDQLQSPQNDLRSAGPGAVALPVIRQASADPRFREHPAPLLRGIESYIAVPLRRVDGSDFGTLCAFDPRPADLHEADLEVFTLLAELVAYVMEEEDCRRQREAEMRALEDFTAIAAHDLRQPLTLLYGRAQMLARQARKGACSGDPGRGRRGSPGPHAPRRPAQRTAARHGAHRDERARARQRPLRPGRPGPGSAGGHRRRRAAARPALHRPRRRPAGRRRPAPGAGVAQSARQRGQVLARAPRAHRAIHRRTRRRRPAHADGGRLGNRGGGGGAGAVVHPPLPRAGGGGPQHQRLRAGPVHRPADCRGARRPHLGRRLRDGRPGRPPQLPRG